MLIAKDIQRLWQHIDSKRHKQVGFLLALMLCTSFAEVLSIGAVLPFLAVLADPAKALSSPYIQFFIHLVKIDIGADQLIAPLAIVFGIAAIVAGIMRVLLLKASTHVMFAIGADLSNKIYSRTLYQPYSVQVKYNSSEIINGITGKVTTVIYGVLIPTVTIISSGIMMVMIMATLLSINPMIAIMAFGGFGIIYTLIIQQTRHRLMIAGKSIAHQSTKIIRSIQEGLGGIRDILIDGSQPTYCHIYKEADLALRNAQESKEVISQSPRYIMETLGMLLIAGLAYILTQDPEGNVKAIPILGTLALGAQRLLPVLHQAYASWSSIQGSKASLQDALILLDQNLPDHVGLPYPLPIKYQQSIALRHVSFRYDDSGPWVLKDINLEIAKGSRVGFIGATGSGKSSLLDVLMGLLPPTEGSLVIDRIPLNENNVRAWQIHIAHVPQNIFLSDATIAENIAFGIPFDQIDHERVKHAAQKAHISAMIESLTEHYQTQVGERGIRLSGGQKQRIGIARALYKQADVIVFDEATSALDNETEQAVMEAIEGLGSDLTIYMVAHRLSTLRNCSQIIELVDGKIKRVGTYQEIVNPKI